MSGIRSLHRGPVQKGFPTGASAPIRVDDTTGKVLINTGGAGSAVEVELKAVSGSTPIAITTATVTLGATHRGRVILLSRAAGIAATLPAATGSGDVYDLVVGITFTGASTIAVANASDYMVGLALLDKVGTVSGFPTANTGTVATESDTISLFGTANANGGIKGAVYEITDVAANIWKVQIRSEAGGTVATPFSVAV